MQSQGLTRTTVILGTDHSPELPPGSIDVALLSDVFHHFEKPVGRQGWRKCVRMRFQC